MSWFNKLIPSRVRTEGSQKNKGTVPEGLWSKCTDCSSVLYRSELERNLEVCPKCGFHQKITARKRLNALFDVDSTTEIGANLEPLDPLKFRDSKRYRDRVSAAVKTTGENEAIIVMKGTLKEQPLVAGAFVFGFMGGSMGSVVGERFVLGVEQAIEAKAPFVCFSASGGARMQESLFSLMQMAKTSAALTKLSEAGLPFISVLTNPTMGGVSASFATLGDLIVAEPKAEIGFAGKRVIEQTVRENLPEGFQTSEFLLEHGAIDMIIDRREMRDRLASILTMLNHRNQKAA